MRYISGLHEGETIRNVYLCKGKRSAETRNGRPYDNLILQDKTGTLDGKVWDPNSGGIADYDEMDFIEVYGEIISYNNNLQLNIKQIRKAQEGEYIAADYMPTTEKSTDGMYEELLGYIKKVENQYLRQVLEYYFVKDETFIRNFKGHSAAKTVHHGFAGGLEPGLCQRLGHPGAAVCGAFAESGAAGAVRRHGGLPPGDAPHAAPAGHHREQGVGAVPHHCRGAVSVAGL